MKILFCKNSFAGPMSGADEIVVSYAIQLKAAGYSPTVLLVHSAGDADPLAARLREGGVPLASLASPKFSTSLAAGRRLAIAAMRVVSPARRLIRTSSRKFVFELIQRYHDDFCRYLTRYRPDLVHVMTPDPGAVMLIRAAHSVGVPVIYQEVGIPFHPPGFEEVYQRFTSVLPLCSDIATLSPRLAQEMNRVIPRIGTPRVVPLISHDPANGLPKTNSTSDSVCFGFASRLEHLKGPLRLIDGFRLASNAHPFISLKIAGEGSQRPQIVRAIPRVSLQGKGEPQGVHTTLADKTRFIQHTSV